MVTPRSHEWQQILSKPLPQAVREAERVEAHRWHPQNEAGAELLAVLSAIDPDEIDKTSTTLFQRTTRVLPTFHLGLFGSAGFAVRHPVVALVGYDTNQTSRIVTADRTGIRSTLYEGAANHTSLCALDDETVIARRESDNGGSRNDTKIVKYTPAGETVLAHGSGLLGAVVRATARGFVLGTKLTGRAYALADGRQEVLALRDFGLRRADLLSVDVTGDRIVFADDHTLLVTDSGLQPLHHITVNSIPHGPISAVTYTGNSIVTAGYDKGLYRWQIIGDRIRGMYSSILAQPRAFFRLEPITPWGQLVAGGGNLNYHYDIDELEPVPAPPFLVQSDPSIDLEVGGAPLSVGTFRSSVHGCLAVYQGSLAIPALDVQGIDSTVIHDLEHPLNILLKPLGALDFDDANRVTPYLSGTSNTYELSASDRAVLDLAVRASRWVPGVG